MDDTGSRGVRRVRCGRGERPVHPEEKAYELRPVLERRDAQVVLANALVPGVPEALRELTVAEDHLERARKLGGIRGIADEQSVDAVADLILDAADRARDDGAPLPQRLGDGEAEALA